MNSPKTPPKGEPMPKTIEHYQKVLDMDNELIHEQRLEIQKLKMKVNQLHLKLKSHKATIVDN